MKDDAPTVNNTTSLSFSFLPRRMYFRGAKRGLDLLLAVLMLPVLLPIIGILWAIARADGGPGFFVQPRVGRHGEVFRCWKLRTMVVDAEAALKKMCDENPALAHEWHVNQKLATDPRITRIGRFLRATSLDELPQIFNVLNGTMSFVGPRPFLTDQEELYRHAGGKAYFKMRPGITGIWQVEGRGETTFVARVGFDNSYFRTLSLRNDMRILLRTVSVVVKRTGH